MTMFFQHALIRLRVAIRSPSGSALLLFCGLVAIVFWPGLTDASGSGWPGGQIGESRGTVIMITTLLVWLVMWPTIATAPIRGHAVNGGRSLAYATQAHPALPIGPRARVLAEALALLAIVMIVRAPAAFLGEIPRALIGQTGATWREWLVQQSVAGALVMLPFLLLAGRTASTIEVYWLRLFAFASALFGAMKLGLLETLPLCLLTCLVLSTLALLLPDRGIRPVALARAWPRSSSLVRRFRSPESQFRRDLWLRPLPVAAALLTAEVVFIGLDQAVGFPDLVFYFLSVLVFSWLLAFVPLQPMRSKMAIAGIFCKPGFKPGDFAAACGVLPVRRRIVVRSVFLYGLVTTGVLWLVLVGVICLSAWFESGSFALVDSDGDPLGRILFPTLAFPPAVAALLTCGILGDRRGSLFAGALLLLLPQVGILLLIYKTAGFWVGVLTVLMAAIAPLPAVKHLRMRRGGEVGSRHPS